MEFSEILLLVINGVSLIILVILIVLILRVKEVFLRRVMHLEESVNEYSKQIRSIMKALEVEIEKQGSDMTDSIEQLNSEIKSEIDFLKQDIKEIIKLLDSKFLSYKDDTVRKFESLKLDVQSIEKDFENMVENLVRRQVQLEESINKHFEQTNKEVKMLSTELQEKIGRLYEQLNRLEKLLKEPIDIEEWINESDR